MATIVFHNAMMNWSDTKSDYTYLHWCV